MNSTCLYRLGIHIKEIGERLHVRSLIILGLKIKDRALGR